MKTLFLILFSLLLIPFVSIATAQLPQLDVLAFVQIIQRDDNGSLIGYLEYDNATIVNLEAFETLLTYGGESTLIQAHGNPYQLTKFNTAVATDASGLMSTVNLGVKGNDGTLHIAVSVAHDGMRLNPDEKASVIWTFLRPL